MHRFEGFGLSGEERALGGNCSTEDILSLLRDRQQDLLSFLNDPVASILELE